MKTIKKYVINLLVVGVLTSTALPVVAVPTYTSMIESIARNGSALAANVGKLLYTGGKYSLYVGLGVTSAASYTAKKVTDSKVALGVVGAAGAYYTVYSWYLKDFFEIEKRYKPIFEKNVLKQARSDWAKLIRFVNENYSKPSHELSQELVLAQITSKKLYAQKEEITRSLSILRTYPLVLDDITLAGIHDESKLKTAVNGSFSTTCFIANTIAFPHYYRINLLYWQLLKTKNNIETIENKLKPASRFNYFG